MSACISNQRWVIGRKNRQLHSTSPILTSENRPIDITSTITRNNLSKSQIVQHNKTQSTCSVSKMLVKLMLPRSFVETDAWHEYMTTFISSLNGQFHNWFSTVEYENPLWTYQLWTNMKTKNYTVDNCGLVVHPSTVRPIIPQWNCGKTSHKSVELWENIS